MRIALVAAGIVLAMVGTSASAQTKYYLRERIVGLPKTAAPVQTPPQTASCPALKSKVFNGGASIGKAATLADAQNLCNAERAKGTAGSCSWQNSTSFAGYQNVNWNTEIRNDVASNADLYGATCS